MLEKQKEGSITAYLTLILFLVLALIATCIESARVSGARVYAKRVLKTALRSTLGEYYLPLYEKYHLFGLDVGYGEESVNEKILKQKIKETMEDGFQPEMNDTFSTLSLNKNFLLYNLSVDSISINERRTLTDMNGEILKSQAIQYKKYATVADALTLLLSKFNALESTEEAITLLEEKMAVEKKLYEIDKQILQLIEYVDGFKVDEAGVEINSRGNPVAKDIFVKTLVNFPVSQSTAQINNQVLYSIIQAKYKNPIDIIDELIAMGEEAVRKKEILESYQDDLDELRKNADYLDPIYIVEELSLRIAVSNARNRYQSCLSQIQSMESNLQKLFLDTMVPINSALTCINNISYTRKNSKQYVDTLMSNIESSKDRLDANLYKELLSSSEHMKTYTEESVTKISIINNMNQMKVTLENNKDVLFKIINNGIPEFSTQGIASWQSSLRSLSSLCKQFRHNGLAIDYSTFNFNKQSNSILKSFKNLIKSGVTGLVIEDIDSLSKASLGNAVLISQNHSIVKEGSSTELDHMLDNITDNKKSNNRVETLEKAGIPISNVLLEGAEALLDNILYISYLEEHFTDFFTERELEEQVLSYEIEYILYGNSSDKENIESVVTRIILVRALLNFLHVFTDAQKIKMASQFATTLVGFSGLPFLVAITTGIILFVWAFEGALVETAAIFQGKEVPIITTKNNFTVQFNEILSMSKLNIINKAKNYKIVHTCLNFGYRDYLRLFLLIQNKEKQNYRTMDIIQENIRHVYDSEFLLMRCTTDYEVSASLYMPQIFLSLPFVIDSRVKSVRGYEYIIDAAVSY